MKERCWNCDHYKDEHENGTGACVCIIVARGGDLTCPCSGFVLTTVEKCEEWISERRLSRAGIKEILFLDQTDHVISFLLAEVRRCGG